jgi:hypothetical protein
MQRPTLPKPIKLPRVLLVAVVLLSAGCSSVISMRDALREGVEQAAAMTQLAGLGDVEHDVAGANSTERADYGSGDASSIIEPTASDLADSLNDDPAAVAAAIETAIDELTEAESLDAASKAALIETLQLTPQADWPIVIQEFTATLTILRDTAATRTDMSLGELAPEASGSDEASGQDQAQQPSAERATALADNNLAASEPAEPLQAPTGEATDMDPAEIDADAASHVQDTPVQPDMQPAAVQTPPVSSVAGATLPAKPAPAQQVNLTTTEQSVAQALSIERPCLAREVRGWGQVEPFETTALNAGSEVIVYFELSGLQATETVHGVSTSIDTRLQLDDATGKRLHSWSFPSLTETCAARRRDYFARFFLDLPADLPAGDHQLVLSVTDLQTATTAETSIPLSVAAAPGS